jgi:hypothetical protein
MEPKRAEPGVCAPGSAFALANWHGDIPGRPKNLAQRPAGNDKFQKKSPIRLPEIGEDAMIEIRVYMGDIDSERQPTIDLGYGDVEWGK